MSEILFLSPTLGVGGSQQHMISFANYLQNKKYKILVINTHPQKNNDLAYRFNEGIELINIPRKFNFDLSPSTQIIAILKERKIKTVFIDSLFSYLFLTKLQKMEGIKTSVIFHVTEYVDIYSYIKDLGVRFLVKRKVQFIGISENQIRKLSKILLIPKKRFKLIYNGIDQQHFNFSQRIEFRKSLLREKYNIPQDAFLIIKVARFNVEKNHELAVRVLEALRNKHQVNAYMMFVGNTNKARMNMIGDMANDLKVGEYIKMPGMQEDVRPYLSISDLFILTSQAVETFSLAALEAMAMGLPAVITDLGGAREMVFDGKNGFVVSFKAVELFAQKVVSIYNGQLEWDNLAISNFVINNFSAETTNSKLENYII